MKNRDQEASRILVRRDRSHQPHVTQKQMKSKIILPKYVCMGGHTTMRLLSASERENHWQPDVRYWRDNGQWGTNVKVKNGKIISCGWDGDMSYLNNKEMVEVTKEEWEKENGEING